MIHVPHLHHLDVMLADVSIDVSVRLFNCHGLWARTRLFELHSSAQASLALVAVCNANLAVLFFECWTDNVGGSGSQMCEGAAAFRRDTIGRAMDQRWGTTIMDTLQWMVLMSTTATTNDQR